MKLGGAAITPMVKNIASKLAERRRGGSAFCRRAGILKNLGAVGNQDVVMPDACRPNQPSWSSGLRVEHGNFLIQTKRVSGAAFPEAIASSICRWCSSSEYPVTTKTPRPLLPRSSFSIRRPIGRARGVGRPSWRPRPDCSILYRRRCRDELHLPLSVEAWYQYKADRCERMAADAAAAADRAKLKREAALWRDIARDIAKQEAAKPYLAASSSDLGAGGFGRVKVGSRFTLD